MCHRSGYVIAVGNCGGTLHSMGKERIGLPGMLDRCFSRYATGGGLGDQTPALEGTLFLAGCSTDRYPRLYFKHLPRVSKSLFSPAMISSNLGW